MKRTKIKLNRSEVDALCNLLNLSTFSAVNDNLLLKEIMFEVQLALAGMLDNPDQRKFTLRLTPAQAIAFLIFWKYFDLSQIPYERLIVNRIVEAIYKMHTNAKQQYAHA